MVFDVYAESVHPAVAQPGHQPMGVLIIGALGDSPTMCMAAAIRSRSLRMP